MEKIEAQLLIDLVGILNRLKKGDCCWCDVAIGNPMLKDHTQLCMDALFVSDAAIQYLAKTWTTKP
jgi:hypothetical protein